MDETPVSIKILIHVQEITNFLPYYYKILLVDSVLHFNRLVKTEDYIILRFHPGTQSISIPEPEFFNTQALSTLA